MNLRSITEACSKQNNLVCSIASEPIQNSEEYINQSEEKIKQDCESKAFIRLAEKIKKTFSETSDHHNGRWIVCQSESYTDLHR